MSSAVPLATRRSATGIPTGRLGIWWVVASEIVIFGGLLACYLLFRLHHLEEWGREASHTNVAAGAFNTFVLLTSSLSVVLAHEAIEHGNVQRAAKCLKLTIVGGLIFLVVKTIEWTGEIHHGYTMFKSVFWSFYYTVCGLHGLHVIGGMIAMWLVMKDIKRGKNFQRVEYVGIYWHFVDMVWIFLFPLFYIAGAAAAGAAH